MKIKDLKRWPKLYAAAMIKLNKEPYPYNDHAHVSVLNKVATPDEEEFWTAVAFGYIDQAKGIYGDLFTEVDVFHTVLAIVEGWVLEDVTTSDFIATLVYDSLGALEIAMHLEEEFGIELPNGELMRLARISDLVQLVEDKLAEKKGVKVTPTKETTSGGFTDGMETLVRNIPDTLNTIQHYHSVSEAFNAWKERQLIEGNPFTLNHYNGVYMGDENGSLVIDGNTPEAIVDSIEGPTINASDSEGIFTLKEYELDKFKRNTREQLNLLASKDMVDGDLLGKFDKLLKEVGCD